MARRISGTDMGILLPVRAALQVGTDVDGDATVGGELGQGGGPLPEWQWSLVGMSFRFPKQL